MLTVMPLSSVRTRSQDWVRSGFSGFHHNDLREYLCHYLLRFLHHDLHHDLNHDLQSLSHMFVRTT